MTMPHKLGRVGMVLESWFYTLNMEAPAGMVGMVVVVVREQAARTESSQAVSSWGNGDDGDEGGDNGNEDESLRVYLFAIDSNWYLINFMGVK